MSKPPLLLVDSDVESLRVMRSSLDQAGYDVSTARDGAMALTKLAVRRPVLLLVATELDDGDGSTLVRKIKADRRNLDLPVVFLAQRDYSVQDRVRALSVGVDDYLKKPVLPGELLARVRLLLAARMRIDLSRKSRPPQREYAGDLADLPLIDLLRAFLEGRHEGEIHLRRPDRQGTVYLRAGRIVDAEVLKLRGEEAVFRLLTWDWGTFSVSLRRIERSATVESDTQEIIAQGLELATSVHEVLASLPALDTVMEVDGAELLARMNEIPEELNGILELFNGKRDLQAVLDESPFDDLSTLQTIAQLRDEELLVVSGGASSGRLFPRPSHSPPRPATGGRAGSAVSERDDHGWDLGADDERGDDRQDEDLDLDPPHGDGAFEIGRESLLPLEDEEAALFDEHDHAALAAQDDKAPAKAEAGASSEAPAPRSAGSSVAPAARSRRQGWRRSSGGARARRLAESIGAAREAALSRRQLETLDDTEAVRSEQPPPSPVPPASGPLSSDRLSESEPDSDEGRKSGAAGTEAFSSPDSGAPDSGAPDSGEPDSAEPDSAEPDSGEPDSGEPDSGEPDSSDERGAFDPLEAGRADEQAHDHGDLPPPSSRDPRRAARATDELSESGISAGFFSSIPAAPGDDHDDDHGDGEDSGAAIVYLTDAQLERKRLMMRVVGSMVGVLGAVTIWLLFFARGGVSSPPPGIAQPTATSPAPSAAAAEPAGSIRVPTMSDAHVASSPSAGATTEDAGASDAATGDASAGDAGEAVAIENALEQAEQLMKRQQWEELVPVATAAIQQHPDNALGYFALAAAYQSLRYVKSSKYFRNDPQSERDLYDRCVTVATENKLYLGYCGQMGGRKKP